MVNFVDATTLNATNTTFPGARLTNGPFGLQEIQTFLVVPAPNRRRWAVWVSTSDLAAVVFAILLLTFAIDHYLYKNRYLVHVGGARRAKTTAAVPDDKAALHEKEARDLESGQKCSNDEGSDVKPISKREPDSQASNLFWRLVDRVAFISLVLIYYAFIYDGEKPASEKKKETPESTSESTSKSTSAKAETESEVENPPAPWKRRVLNGTILLLLLLFTLLFFAFHIAFWPVLLMLFILGQGGFFEYLNQDAMIPWQSIAFETTAYLTIWTLIGATLMMKPNRFQGILWIGFKWTHAVSWWVFWGFMESYYIGGRVAGWFGFDTEVSPILFVFVVQRLLVPYLYSGIVCNVVIGVRLVRHFWNLDLPKV
jgi:hypothetical protein